MYIAMRVFYELLNSNESLNQIFPWLQKPRICVHIKLNEPKAEMANKEMVNDYNRKPNQPWRVCEPRSEIQLRVNNQIENSEYPNQSVRLVWNDESSFYKQSQELR